ncbi:MAG: beta-galactosidase, partial [Tabrizicola sp.]
MKRTLGVCYYPEHWNEAQWAEDAARMARLGLTWVRISEFAWSRMEPEPGRYDWDWLDRAIATLGARGLKVVLGTPTATPPRWMVDKHPDMFAVDAEGRMRGFGSRRHYDFSHRGYRAECAKIVGLMAERYGKNPHVAAWQTDNEYACHETTLSYSEAAKTAFQDWLAQKYQSPDALNRAWGNVFWSMEYRDFREIGLPNLTVTEPNPSHVMDFRRFASEEVRAFNKLQVDIIRKQSAAPVAHNFMGAITEFDHWDVGADLDIASWDSYPLGFLSDRIPADAEHKRRFVRQGDPDFQAFHHDLYRAVGRGRWWIMEQQPGPVNWAARNPAPLPGMVRLWTLEAMAHGAEFVAYFRWRQAPFAQEQMHAGLLRPDRVDDVGAHEARTAAQDIAHLAAATAATTDTPDTTEAARAPVALVFDYESVWVTDIQPQGAGFSALRQAFAWYSAMRAFGLDIDILPPDASLEGYALIGVPCLPILPEGFVDRVATCGGQVLIGPRSGSKTAQFTIPAELPPGELQRLIALKVTRVESL